MANPTQPKPSMSERTAAAWLLLAYTLNHKEDCQCERCPTARQAVSKGKTVAA